MFPADYLEQQSRATRRHLCPPASGDLVGRVLDVVVDAVVADNAGGLAEIIAGRRDPLRPAEQRKYMADARAARSAAAKAQQP